ncbi:MAG: oxygen-independent coproporphyrinogen III oxidase [Gemmobacter sp.]
MTADPQLAALGLFDARVPRYTSYPTAPQFGAAVGPEAFAGWIGAIPPGSQISLYLHVPFCRRLCWFCACRTQGSPTDRPVLAYAETLAAEIAMIGRLLPEGVTLSRLHWGGGTPTMLPPAEIRALSRAIATIAPMAPGAEFSVEIDPGEIDAPRLDALAEAGMNRASIGVQDFDEAIQKAIGRDQSFEITAEAVAGLRARGIASLNADIVYGLPHQTAERIAASVQKLLSLSPDRVALYGYAHVPWMSRRQQLIPSEAIPRAEERLDLFEVARALFDWDGFVPVGIDHFARPADGLARALAEGRLRRNFQGYTDDAAPVLIGLGASAISRFPQGYAQNAAATSDYARAIREGWLATARGHAFSGEDLLRGRMIEMLLCDFAIDRAAILRAFPQAQRRVDALLSEAAARFAGMVALDAQGLSITHRGRPLARMIACVFDGYDLSKAGHSSAV